MKYKFIFAIFFIAAISSLAYRNINFVRNKHADAPIRNTPSKKAVNNFSPEKIGSTKAPNLATNSETKDDIMVSFDTEMKRVDYYDACKETPENLANGSETLTTKQAKIFDMLMEKCSPWYDYFFQLSDQERDKIREERKSSRELFSYFTRNRRNYSKELIADARTVFIDSKDDYPIIGSLEYLLINDDQLIKDLFVDAQITHVGLPIKNRMDITQLYYCRIEPDECRPSSFSMVGLCLMQNSYCGLSYSEYIRQQYYPEEYNNMERITSSLVRFREDGYFDEPSGPSP